MAQRRFTKLVIFVIVVLVIRVCCVKSFVFGIDPELTSYNIVIRNEVDLVGYACTPELAHFCAALRGDCVIVSICLSEPVFTNYVEKSLVPVWCV